jgi:hypothetical protein
MGMREDVRRIASERPNYVYKASSVTANGVPQCVYTNDDGTPGCIMGHWFHENGVSDTSDIEGVSIGSYTINQHLDRWGIPPITEGEQAWAELVQIAQDEGASWGEAVAQADRLETK